LASIAQERSRQRAAIVAVYLVPVAVAAALVLVHWSDEPFWRDEVATVSVAGRPLTETVRVLVNGEFNGSLYYLLINPWISLFGDGESAVRLPSLLFTLAGIAAAVHLSRTLWGLTAAAVTGAILASSQFLLSYAGEARTYALATALAPVATMLFVRAVEREEQRDWLLWAIVCGALVYAEALAALLVAVQLCSLVCLESWRRRGLGRGVGALAVIVTPLIAVTVISGGEGQTSWIPQFRLVDLRLFATSVAGPAAVRLLFAAVALAAVGLLGRELIRHRRSEATWRMALPVMWAVLPVIALAVISLRKGLFIDRYLLFTLPGFAVMAGGVVASTPAAAGRAAAAILLLACFALAVADPPWELERTEDLRAAAAFVANGTRPGDGIAYSPAFSRVGLAYYLDRKSRRPVDIDIGRSAMDRGELFPGEQPASVVARRLRAARRIWIVGYPSVPWHPTPEPVAAVAPQILREGFDLVTRRPFGGIEIALYRRIG
jgi:mannosyltransferase